MCFAHSSELVKRGWIHRIHASGTELPHHASSPTPHARSSQQDHSTTLTHMPPAAADGRGCNRGGSLLAVLELLERSLTTAKESGSDKSKHIAILVMSVVMVIYGDNTRQFDAREKCEISTSSFLNDYGWHPLHIHCSVLVRGIL